MRHWTNAIPLAAASVLYIWSSVNFFRANNWPMGLVWMCYAVANIGYIVLILENRL